MVFIQSKNIFIKLNLETNIKIGKTTANAYLKEWFTQKPQVHTEYLSLQIARSENVDKR